MNTNDLYLEYARVIKMCEGTKLEDRPWVCVKVNGSIFDLRHHPNFNAKHNFNAQDYVFAVAVLEERPVFVGDRLWLKDGHQFAVEDDLHIDHKIMSWTPPSPKRTFTLNGVEFPCPDPGLDPWVNGFSMGIEINGYGESFAYASHDDAEKVFKYLKNLLTEARDKT